MFYVASTSSETLFWTGARSQIPVTLNICIDTTFVQNSFKLKESMLLLIDFFQTDEVCKLNVHILELTFVT